MPDYCLASPGATEAPPPWPARVKHPSFHGQALITMNSMLSNYEFRAYLRATGFISLYLSSRLLVESPIPISTSHIENVTGLLRLTNVDPLVLDGIGVLQDRTVPFDGTWASFDIRVPAHTRLRECRTGLADLDLRFCFGFRGALAEARVRRIVTILRVRDSWLKPRTAALRPPDGAPVD